MGLCAYYKIQQAIKEGDTVWYFSRITQYIIDVTLKSKLIAIKKGKKLLINYSGGYSYLDREYTILETVEKARYVFPNMTERDIRITKWPKGTHFYAKIGNIEVVDEAGNTKWNTEDDAYREAKKYLLKYCK